MLLAVAGIMTFASCKKDNPSPLTKEEAVIALTTTDTEYATFSTELEGSTETAVQNAVSELSLPSGTPTKAPANVASSQDKLMKTINSTSAKGGGGINPLYYFDFMANAGTWSKVNGIWTKTLSTPVDKVVYIFSYNGTNNGTVTFSDFEEKTYVQSTQTIKYISKVTSTVAINGVKVYSWTYTSSIGLQNFNVEYVYNLGKFTKILSASYKATLSLAGIKATASMSYEMKKDGVVFYAQSANVTSNNTQAGYSYVADAKFRVGDIVVKYLLNIDGTINLQGDPDNYLTISVWTTGGAKIADVVFDLLDGYYVPYFKFTDDPTPVLVSTYPHFSMFSDFADEIRYLGGGLDK